ncbi:ABC transporter permease subunit [Aestuariimicrobium soli]|uniref:ABC transporter permease subunit n=1 Tax=Aestuariimicrobium soli TaxID=2035834 RepID=UPI003EB69F5B
MSAHTDAVRSEWTKQVTTSAWWVLGLVLFAYVAFTAGTLGFVFAASATGRLTGDNAMPMPADSLPALLYSTGTAIGYVFPLLIGTMMITGEVRHQTLTPTFLATPRRWRVLAAKLVVGAVLGVLHGLVAVVASVAPSAGLLAAMGLPTDLDTERIWALLARMLVATVLWVLIGIGVGALVRHQVAAIVGVIVFTQFVEPIVRVVAAFVPVAGDVANFLPGAASDALVGASLYTQMTGASSAAGLDWWAGALVMVAYAVVFLVLGWRTSWRRDIT